MACAEHYCIKCKHTTFKNVWFSECEYCGSMDTLRFYDEADETETDTLDRGPFYDEPSK